MYRLTFYVLGYLSSGFGNYVYLKELMPFLLSFFKVLGQLVLVNPLTWFTPSTLFNLNKDFEYSLFKVPFFFSFQENQEYYVSKYSFFNETKDLNFLLRFKNQFNESSNQFRYVRTLNPVFRYDYKLGNYFTKDDTTTLAFLFTTINDLTGGIRKSS